MPMLYGEKLRLQSPAWDGNMLIDAKAILKWSAAAQKSAEVGRAKPVESGAMLYRVLEAI